MPARLPTLLAAGAFLLGGSAADAQSTAPLTLKKAEDEDLILFPWNLQVGAVEDMSVAGPDGTAYGEVEDVLVDPAGSVRALVIDYGDQLGPAGRQAIVTIERLQPGDAKHLVLNMAPAELQALPDYDD